MTRLEQGRRKFDLRESMVRGTVGVVMGVAGAGAFSAGTYDAFANTVPEAERFSDSLDERYPLLDSEEVEASQDNILAFVKDSKELVNEGREIEFSELIVVSGVLEDYEKINQQFNNQSARDIESEERAPNYRIGLDMLGVIFGAVMVCPLLSRLTSIPGGISGGRNRYSP